MRLIPVKTLHNCLSSVSIMVHHAKQFEENPDLSFSFLLCLSLCVYHQLYEGFYCFYSTVTQTLKLWQSAAALAAILSPNKNVLVIFKTTKVRELSCSSDDLASCLIVRSR